MQFFHQKNVPSVAKKDTALQLLLFAEKTNLDNRHWQSSRGRLSASCMVLVANAARAPLNEETGAVVLAGGGGGGAARAETGTTTAVGRERAHASAWSRAAAAAAW